MQAVPIQTRRNKMDLTVVIHNVFGLRVGDLRERITRICVGIRSQRPDVVMLQEVHTWHCLKLILALLPELRDNVAYVPGRLGPAGGLVILASRPVEEIEFEAFSRRIWHIGRGFHKGVLSCRVAGIRLVNFHLSSNPKGKWTKPNWRLRAQRKQLVKLIEILNGFDGERLIAGGDSNFDRSTELYRELITGAGLIDPFDDTPTLMGADDQLWCVDFILVRGFAKDLRTRTWQLFHGLTAKWTTGLRGKHVVSDHEARCLTLINI